jgi:hypothetical protein
MIQLGHSDSKYRLTTRSSRTQCQAFGLPLRRLAPTLAPRFIWSLVVNMCVQYD